MKKTEFKFINNRYATHDWGHVLDFINEHFDHRRHEIIWIIDLDTVYIAIEPKD